ncbi:MAG: endo-1,4-beta-xylanase [Treponema sp.]|jgi:endo-1,4-beta-xylanase|nr:endo-1,4-beta-xylanase [Treponema sp.]
MFKKKFTAILLILLLTTAFLSCPKDDAESVGTDIMSLTPMKDSFASYFLIGNIFNPQDVSGSTISNTRITRHYNILTHENHMKPINLSSGYNAEGNGGLGSHTRISSGFTTANNMVNAALAANIKVVGHTLLWHSQIPSWQQNMASQPSADALKAMRVYITDVVSYLAGRIHTWDVLNEVFPDGVSASADWTKVMRTGGANTGNPWYVAIGSDFVYEGFLAARLADPDAILYYNDYNTDQVGKATMIRNMVVAVNNKYLTGSDKPGGEDPNRLLIEGIGMQEHHNTSVQASSVKATLTMFNNMTFTNSNRKIRISVSELDILSQTWGQYSSNTAITSQGRTDQANLYGSLFKEYLAFSSIIERVSFWGIIDSQSWRPRGEPLIFDSSGKSKQAYHNIINTLK